MVTFNCFNTNCIYCQSQHKLLSLNRLDPYKQQQQHYCVVTKQSDWLKEETHNLSLKRVRGLLMNIHEFRNTLIRVSYAIKTQRTYNALETHMKREFAGQIRGRKCINHQYMDIYNTGKQTENIPCSCSYLLLKTLFYFISQCTSVPYLESGLCR